MQKLFSEFKPSTAQDWKNQVIKDLKGEAFESLIWQNENGFDINPFYTSEDLQKVYQPAFTHSDWEICVKGKSKNASKLNTQLLQQLNSGATSFALNAPDSIDFDKALKGIQLNYIQSTYRLNVRTATDLKSYLDKNYPKDEVACSFLPESFSTKEDFEKWKKVIALFRSRKNARTLSADVFSYHNLNCFAFYEVAIVMSQFTEYIEALATSDELPTSAFVVRTGVNTDYFVQIAKLRAIRRLWKVLKSEYQIQNDLYIIAETSFTNKAISDSYTNLLRTTVEAMAAVSGGCNELIVNEFDILFPTNKVLGERMAINQQLILKEESYLNKMADISCGSYYIEHLTDALAEKALETFKRFEMAGGYFKCVESGLFKDEIKLQAEQREVVVKSKKQVLIGVNKYKNETEKIELKPAEVKALKDLKLNNPGLNFEFEHYFTLNHA